MKYPQYILICLIAAFVITPAPIFAKSVITNEIHNSVSTGGNKAEGGSAGQNSTLTTGSQTSEIHIETMVNGEQVENIHETVVGQDPLTIDRSQQIDDGEVHTRVEVNEHASSTDRGIGGTNIESKAGAKVKIRLLEMGNSRQQEILRPTSTQATSTARKVVKRSFAQKIFTYVRTFFKR